MTHAKPIPFVRAALAALVLGALAAGCGPSHSEGGGHAHTAPHGGQLVEVGDHAYNLEFVHDREAGRLTAYVLDGHAENFIRIDAPAITVTVSDGTTERPLVLAAVASAATGETVGNTSQFEATADWLKAPAALTVKIPALTLRGSAFTGIEAALPAAK